MTPQPRIDDGRPTMWWRAACVVCLLASMASPGLAQKGSDGAPREGSPPAFAAIVSDPLTIHVAEDLSFQVFDSSVPGAGQVYPTGSVETGDMGILARVNGTMFRPDFAPHPGQTGAYGYSGTGPLFYATAWTSVSLGSVTGSGTKVPDDPRTLVVTADAGTTGVRFQVTVTCYDGDEFFSVTCNVINQGAASATVDYFLAADMHLAGSDSGTGYHDVALGAVGTRTCKDPLRAMLLVAGFPAPLYSVRHWTKLWPEIGNGHLQGIVDAACHDVSAAIERKGLSVGAGQTSELTARVVIASGATNPCSTPSGMRAWWSFDEAAPVTQWADAAYGNDGLPTVLSGGGPPVPAPGKIGNAVYFDSSSINIVEVPDGAPYDIGTSDFTIDAWVRVEAVIPAAGGIYAKGVFSVLLPDEPRLMFSVLAPGNGLQLLLAMGSVQEASLHVSDGVGFPPLKWAHVAVTVDRAGDDVRFYINGVQVPTANLGGTPVVQGSLDSSQPAWMGFAIADSGTITQFQKLVGSIDELEIYHRALSPAEVASIAVSGKCKGVTHVPWMTTLCPPGQATSIPVTLCNDGPLDTTFAWYVMPSISGGLCNAPFAPAYALPGGSFPEFSTVAAMSCETFLVTVPSVTLQPDQLLCYEVVSQDLATGVISSTTGMLRPSGPVVAWKPIGSGGFWPVGLGFGSQVLFAIDNTSGGTASIAYEIVAASTGPGELLLKPEPPLSKWRKPSSGLSGVGTLLGWEPVVQTLADLVVPDEMLVSLDGQPPGAAASGTVIVPAGAIGAIAVDVLALDLEPFAVTELLLLADVDGDGTKEVIATESVTVGP